MITRKSGEFPPPPHETINLLTPRSAKPESPLPRAAKKGGWFFVILLIVFLGVGIGRLALSHNSNSTGKRLSPKTMWSLTAVKNFIFPNGAILAGQENDRVNILLLGIGGTGHDGPFLSDTNIIISLKPSTKQVAMISIPRDLAVKIPGYGYHKINSADAIGENLQPGNGGDYARQIFVDTFGIDIPYYVRVDFKAFSELIDEVGGVTINVPTTFTDTLYPGPNDSYQTVSFTAGEQTMNGERALIYARSRHGGSGEGSDFARARRQQQVLVALKEKMLSLGTYLNPLRIQGIIDSVTNNIATNLSFDQLMYLASIAKDTDKDEIKNLVFDTSPEGFLVDTTGLAGAFMLTPKSGDFGAVNSAIAGIFEATSTVKVIGQTAMPVTPPTNPLFAKAQLEVQNGTWQVGLAARMKRNLEQKGFSVAKVGNSAVRPIATTTIYIVHPGVDLEIITNLEKELNTHAEAWPGPLATEGADETMATSPPVPNGYVRAGNKLSPDATTDILITIGTNYFNQ